MRIQHAAQCADGWPANTVSDCRNGAKFTDAVEGVGIDIGHHAAVEDRLPILSAIVYAVQADNRSLKVKINKMGYPHHVRQRRAQERRFIVVARSRDKRRDDIAIPVAEGDYLIALDLLVWAETVQNLGVITPLDETDSGAQRSALACSR